MLLFFRFFVQVLRSSPPLSSSGRNVDFSLQARPWFFLAAVCGFCRTRNEREDPVLLRGVFAYPNFVWLILFWFGGQSFWMSVPCVDRCLSRSLSLVVIYRKNTKNVPLDFFEKIRISVRGTNLPNVIMDLHARGWSRLQPKSIGGSMKLHHFYFSSFPKSNCNSRQYDFKQKKLSIPIIFSLSILNEFQTVYISFPSSSTSSQWHQKYAKVCNKENLFHKKKSSFFLAVFQVIRNISNIQHTFYHNVHWKMIFFPTSVDAAFSNSCARPKNSLNHAPKTSTV